MCFGCVGPALINWLPLKKILSWKKNISIILSWFIWGIKGNLEFKYKWEREKKSLFSLKCLSIFTFLFLGMNSPQAFMSRVSYFCPDVTHSLCLPHYFSSYSSPMRWMAAFPVPHFTLFTRVATWFQFGSENSRLWGFWHVSLEASPSPSPQKEGGKNKGKHHSTQFDGFFTPLDVLLDFVHGSVLQPSTAICISLFEGSPVAF